MSTTTRSGTKAKPARGSRGRRRSKPTPVKPLSAVAKEILGGLLEYRDSLVAETPSGRRYTSRTVEIDLAPGTYRPPEVRQTRELLNRVLPAGEEKVQPRRELHDPSTDRTS